MKEEKKQRLFQQTDLEKKFNYKISISKQKYKPISNNKKILNKQITGLFKLVDGELADEYT